MNFFFFLLSWAKLLKNEFWSLFLHWAKMWEITTLTEFAIESKSVQKFIFDRFCPFGQKPDKCQFCYHVWHPCKCPDKVKVILVFPQGKNLRQIRHLPPLPVMQNFGKFGPTSWAFLPSFLPSLLPCLLHKTIHYRSVLTGCILFRKADVLSMALH